MQRSDSQESLSDDRSDGAPSLRVRCYSAIITSLSLPLFSTELTLLSVLQIPTDSRDRAGSGPPSPKEDGRASPSPLKGDKRASPSPLKEKRTLSQRLSAKIFGASKGGAGKPASYYRDAFKKKAISKADMLALQEEFRSQPPTWLLKFDEEATQPLEAFLHHINARNEYAF